MREQFSSIDPSVDALIKSVDPFLPPGFDVIDLPRPEETAAVALQRPKMAALCYDRVWATSADVPRAIAFSAPTFVAWKTVFLSVVVRASLNVVSEDDEVARFAVSGLEAIRESVSELPDPAADLADRISRSVAEEMETEYEVTPVCVYGSTAELSREYRHGDHAVIVATLADLHIADEHTLTWEQVTQFRRDGDAVKKYRRLCHWLDSEMIGRTWNFVRDEIAIRLDDYDAALRRHGVQTIVGSLSSILESKALIGGAAAIASLSYAADPFWGLIAGGATVAGQAAVTIARSLIDLQHIKARAFPEIAFVAEVRSAN